MIALKFDRDVPWYTIAKGVARVPLFLPLRGQGARASMAACFSKNLTAKSKNTKKK